MNKKPYLLVIFLFMGVNIQAQPFEFDLLKYKLLKKVDVGSTTNEIKKILGKPTAVESGFPNSREMLIKEIPEQIGQLNNSTWFYYLPSKKIIGDCYVNDILVDKGLFMAYLNSDKVYFYKDELILPEVAEQYILLRDARLKSAEKDEHTTSIRIKKGGKGTISFIPILCVIFDKGTQVVADSRVYFKIAD